MKELKLFAFALIAVLACVVAASCSKDDGDVTPPGQTEIENETGKRLTGVGEYRFRYDDKGQCSVISHYEDGVYDYDEISIDWDKKEFIYREAAGQIGTLSKFKTNSQGYITEVEEYMINENGDLVRKIADITLSYDKAGYLINCTSKSHDTTVEASYKWKNGNIVNTMFIEDYIESDKHQKYEGKCEISYDLSSKNIYKQWTEGAAYGFGGVVSILCHVGLFGVGTVNFPTHIVEYSVENGNTYEDDYSVSVSTYSSGLISSEKFDGETYDYTYDEVGTRSNSFDSSLPAKAKKRPLRHHRKMWK